MIKQCVICDGFFEARSPLYKTCSKECSRTHSVTEKKKARGTFGPKRCIECETIFLPPTGSQITCSDACARERHTRQNKESRGKRQATKDCAVCGAAFYPTFSRRRAVTCSIRCSNHHKDARRFVYIREWRAKNAERLKAKDREYYANNRDKWLSDTAEKTAAIKLVRQIESTGIVCMEVDIKSHYPSCAVCGEPFAPAKRRKTYTLCSKRECRSEWARRCANKQHHGADVARHQANLDNDHVNVRVEYTEKHREYQRLYKAKARASGDGGHLERNRMNAAKRSAALKLIREIQSKGMEALL